MISKLFYTLPILAISQWVVSNDAVGQPTAVPSVQSSQLPPPPLAQRSIPEIRIDRAGAAKDQGPAGPAVQITSLRVSGATRFSEAQLVAAAGFVPGRAVTLPDLRRMAARIVSYYNAREYIVAQAYLPAQDITDGAVTIVVIEGRYGVVNLQNRSRVHDAVARGVLGGLKSGDVVAAAPLERRLLLLSDLPGVQVRSTLSPGERVGTSNLTVDLAPGPRVSGDPEVDNYGNPYTGVYQGGGTVNFNEPLGIGDVASVRVLTSGSGLQYVRGSYQAQAGVATVGAAYAYFHYRLGGRFSSLDADGSEQIASLYASYPLVRSYDNTLRLVADADYRILEDRIGVTETHTDRAAAVLTLGLNGDHHDRLWGGGWDVYSLAVSGGDLHIHPDLARAQDAAGARTEGGYGKLRFSLDRLQTISGPFSLYGSVRGQAAFKNLDVTEKMELGGAYGVRAYPEGEAYGDEGYLATAEARLWLSTPRAFPGRLQLFGFFDTGWVRYSETPWFPGPNSATRSGAGVGLTWAVNNNFLARVAYAHRVGTGPATSYPSSSGQFWFEVVKFF